MPSIVPRPARARSIAARTPARDRDHPSPSLASRAPSRNPYSLIKRLFTMTMETLETTLSASAALAETLPAFSSARASSGMARDARANVPRRSRARGRDATARATSGASSSVARVSARRARARA